MRFDLATRTCVRLLCAKTSKTWRLASVRAQGDAHAASLLRFSGVRGAWVHGCRPLNEVAAFLQVEGADNGNILLAGNDLRGAKRVVDLADGASDGVVELG